MTVHIGVIGGAGMRVPLLLQGFVASDVPIESVRLYDVDEARLNVIAEVASRMCPTLRIERAPSVEACARDAAFVFLSIRVGGIESRERDEDLALRHGFVPQETVGVGGFSMALRTVPVAIEIAERLKRVSPDAWIINFTNPVSIITQALRAHTGVRVIGICDTPCELFEGISDALELPSAECHFDYVGLNHLGWVREVYAGAKPQLHRLWASRERLQRVYRAPLFSPDELCALRLLPTEYLYYYDHPQDALRHVREAGTTRAKTVRMLTMEFLRAVRDEGAEPVAAYQRYLAARDASYMQIESGSREGIPRPAWTALTGYDKIALSVVRAMVFRTGDVIALNIENRGNIPDLDEGDIIEAPCTVSSNGPLALHVGALPPAVGALVCAVKAYERRTIHAARTGYASDAIDALADHPLVQSRERAARVVGEILAS